MKHLKVYEGESLSIEDSDKSLVDIKREIFLSAKKEYMNALADALEHLGFKVENIDMSEVVDDFVTDKIFVTYDGVRMKLQMSHSGVSLKVESPDPRMKTFDTSSFSTKFKTLAKKIIKHLEQNPKKK